MYSLSLPFFRAILHSEMIQFLWIIGQQQSWWGLGIKQWMEGEAFLLVVNVRDYVTVLYKGVSNSSFQHRQKQNQMIYGGASPEEAYPIVDPKVHFFRLHILRYWIIKCRYRYKYIYRYRYRYRRRDNSPEGGARRQDTSHDPLMHSHTFHNLGLQQ